MKELLKFSFGLIIILSFGSCKKENIEPLTTPIAKSTLKDNGTLNIPPRSFGEMACIIEYKDGTIALGTRCGTPYGKCGPKTECTISTVIEPKLLPEGMSEQEFIETWNNESTRKNLSSLGYYSIDK